MRSPAFAALLALVPMLSTATALAQQTPDESARRALIAQAEEARRVGDHALAVERALRAAQLRATPSIQYFLAREHEALGQAVETLEQAEACARGAEADEALHSRDVLLHACRAIVARTEGRVGSVTVRTAAPLPPGATVRVAGRGLGADALGVARRVMPGVVRIEASAAGYEAWQREVNVAAGASLDVTLTLVATPPPPPPPVPIVVVPPPTVVTPRPAIVRPSRSLTPLVVGGVGAVVSFAAAGVLYGVAMGAQADRDGACRGSPLVCDASAGDDDARYRRFVYATDVALGVGVAAIVAGGLVWWFRRSAGGAVGPRVVVAPVVDGRGAAGASLVITM